MSFAGRVAVNLLRSSPEGLSTYAVRHLLRTRKNSFGLGDHDPRIACAAAAFKRAFPEQKPGEWVGRWQDMRATVAADSLTALARMATGRRSRVITEPMPQVREGAAVVAFPHTVLDPLPQMSLLAAEPQLRFCWPYFPLASRRGEQDGDWGDDRAIWTLAGEPPERLQQALVPITDPRWLVRSVGELRRGGAVLMAMDVAFDGKRPASVSIDVGEASIPLSPAIAEAARLTGARLLFLHPVQVGGGRWQVRLQEAADAERLALMAREWIASHPLVWAGWPFLACRESAVAMREARTGAGAP